MNTSDTARRLGVNAAFLKDIKDDNQHLKQLLDRIDPLIKHPTVACNHWSEISALLDELRDQLAFHFSLEEAYGYFDSALDTDPLRSAEAEHLRAAHPKLFARIRDLADRAGETAPDAETKVAAVVSDYKTFFRSFADHEEAELRLILSTLDDDIGVGD
ncbi:hemerythrin domain-containing protein [Crateriforma conspicua]|uniref:Hemerythrin-like domain-containing protein n=1 Tax=Crateriforma conspicua TaxID=2527996 RepID=A0A5C5XS64_9PLAN|nr:hemerythrin domain-containing protein [Crateriforma conspicua]TWT65744.1 hypothetical protein Pan14r_52930 [Crateriforma conspicua]